MVDVQAIRKEYMKCISDTTRIYAIEHFLSTNNAGSVSPFILFPRQKAFCHSLAEHKSTIAIKHRQAGITTVSAAWIACQILFADENSPETVLCIANKLDMAADMLGKIKTFIDQFPRWMWMNSDYYDPDPKNKKNFRSIYLKSNKAELLLFNGCRVVARASKENASRGVSAVSILVFDEAAFLLDGPKVYSSAVAATASVPHARIIMVSTPNGKDELYYDTYQKALDKRNGYNVVEFKWFQDLRYNKHLSWTKVNKTTGEIERIVEKVVGPKGEVEYNEKRWRQLENDGWKPTSPWYEGMCNDFNHDSVRIAQELDVSFLGSTYTVVEPEITDMHLKKFVHDPLPNMSDPLAKETWFWKPPVDGHRYICAVDPARGDGEDNTVIEMIDMDAVDEDGFAFFEQVMEYQGKRTADEIGQMIENYGLMYNNALVVIEGLGGVGDPAILYLMNVAKYPNLYYDDDNLKKYTAQTDFMRYKNSGHSNKQEHLAGFRTNQVRYQMLTSFAGILKRAEFRVYSIRMIHELETWIFKNGRPDHMSGAHDDTLTATAMGLFVMQYSYNKLQSIKSKDAAILAGYFTSRSLPEYARENPYKKQEPKKEFNMPIYSTNSLESKYTHSNIMWLLAK